MTDKFDLVADIRGKEIKFRKWKVKDKKKFLQNKSDPLKIKEALVYDCLEDNDIALSEEEYKYMLIRIREESIDEKVQYEFTCDHCNQSFDFEANLNEINKPIFKEYGDIIVGKHIFKMTNLRNRNFYENTILGMDDEEERALVDFILHVDSYNSQDGLSFEGLVDVINDLDVKDFEKIFKQWEDMKFKVDNIEPVSCPHCGNVEQYEFDDLPGFFPDSWNL